MLSPAVRVLSAVGLLACYACVSAVRVLPAVRVLSAVPRAVLQKMPGCLSTMDVKKVVRVQKVKNRRAAWCRRAGASSDAVLYRVYHNDSGNSARLWP